MCCGGRVGVGGERSAPVPEMHPSCVVRASLQAGTSVREQRLPERDWQAAPGGAAGGGDTPMDAGGDDDPIEECSGDDDPIEECSGDDDPIEEGSDTPVTSGR
jgi:hypothetical protein